MKQIKKLLLTSLLTAFCLGCYGSSITIRTDKEQIFIQNQWIERTIRIQDGITTTSIINKLNGKEYSNPLSREFDITINGKSYCGKDFHFISAKTSDITNGKQIDVLMKGKSPEISDVEIILSYIIYEDSPVIRKQLTLINKTGNELELTNLNMESLYFFPAYIYMSNIYANYGTNFTRIPYVGDYYDSAILVYNEQENEGIILGNESPSTLKRTDCYLEEYQIAIGMKRSDDEFPFIAYVKAGQTFESPRSFIMITTREKWEDCFDVDLAQFVRENLGVKLFGHESYPLFYYCTWMPFNRDINEKLIKDMADNLESTGVDVLLIDDGWQDRFGDWNTDLEKFPKGIEETCSYIRSKGLTPGMWFTLATVRTDSKVFKEHPDWAIKGVDGLPGTVYHYTDIDITMSMCSPYYDYIYEKLSYYIKACQLGYLKLDFSVASSAYVTDYVKTGDHSFRDTEHGYYKDQRSSYWAIYNATIKFFKQLKKDFPDLIVDCTFELWGRYHINDYALIQYADVDWLTNYNFPAPRGPISIRQMNSERGRVFPVNTMLVGNQLIDSPMYQFAYLSLASGIPVMCGDPRNLTAEHKDFYSKWSGWFRGMDNKYQYSHYYFRSDVFDHATPINWDGAYRFNNDKGGGILFFYRNNSLDEERTFPVTVVDANKKYHVYEPLGGKDWGIYTGKDLREKGLKITIPNRYDAKILGIEEVK